MSKIPAVLIVDDPPINAAYLNLKQMEEAGMPARNDGWFWRTYLARWKEMAMSAIIPNPFFKKFIDWTSAEGVKGKCSLLPCPGGLGRLDNAVTGYSSEQLNELLNLFRNDYVAQFDITPEILTHTLVWSIQDKKTLPFSETEWLAQQDEATLTDYMAEGLQILRNVGIIATGMTQPGYFKGDFAIYARAVLEAEKRINGISRTYYFNDTEGENFKVQSKVVIADPAKNEYVVSIASGSKGDEPFWHTLYGEGDPKKLADYYITEDGKEGRFIDLLSTDSPLVFHVHGQTLYSNGSEIGFHSLQEVVQRMHRHLRERIVWMKISDYAEWVIENDRHPR